MAAPPMRIPIFLATLGPKSLEMTGEIADGWLASSFTPDNSGPLMMRSAVARSAPAAT